MPGLHGGAASRARPQPLVGGALVTAASSVVHVIQLMDAQTADLLDPAYSPAGAAVYAGWPAGAPVLVRLAYLAWHAPLLAWHTLVLHW